MSGRPAADRMVCTMIRIGTASSAPTVPHTHPQKLIEMRIITGLMVSLCPTISGVTTFASIRCAPYMIAGAASAVHTSEKVISPPTASNSAATTGPK
nr:hypothetical protein [Sphingomonas sp.]